MRMRKQKRIGILALSLLLVSYLSTPTIALAAEPELTAAEQSAAALNAPYSDNKTTDDYKENADSNNTRSNRDTYSDSETGSDSGLLEEDSFPAELSQGQDSGANSPGASRAPQQGPQKGIEEPAADEATTTPNNVNTVVPSDDKLGSDISYKAKVFFFNIEKTATITPDDLNSDKTLGEVSPKFNGTDLGATKVDELVIKGDMSIDGDTTKNAAHEVEKNSKHDVTADLDVSPIHTSIEKSAGMLSTFGGASAADAVYVNNLEAGLRSTFTFGSELNGEFYVPSSLEDAQAHYILSSADGSPMIYRINYSNSTFTKDKVSILMDLDLTQMDALNSTYAGSDKVLYGENGVMENFNHSAAEYGSTYDTSTFGNLKQLITSSAKKISLKLKDVLFHSASGNSDTAETETETTTTTQGSMNGSLVGYMKATAGHSKKANVSYIWGAVQDEDGKDVNATGDNVMLSTQFTETSPKDNPSNPDTPSAPSGPDTPSNPSVNTGSNNPVKADQTSAITPESPRTGDTSSLFLWLLAVIVSAVICVASIIYLKKKKNNR